MKWSWTNLRYYIDTCLEVMRKTTKNLVEDSQTSGRDLNPGRP
jgi:hypothetical protein